MEILSNVVISVGAVFILFGVIGIFRFREFYTRILVTAKIDTVGMITVAAGLMIKHGFSSFSLKLLLLTAVLMIINPLAAHFTARSAHESGYGKKGETDLESGERV